MQSLRPKRVGHQTPKPHLWVRETVEHGLHDLLFVQKCQGLWLCKSEHVGVEALNGWSIPYTQVFEFLSVTLTKSMRTSGGTLFRSLWTRFYRGRHLDMAQLYVRHLRCIEPEGAAQLLTFRWSFNVSSFLSKASNPSLTEPFNKVELDSYRPSEAIYGCHDVMVSWCHKHVVLRFGWRVEWISESQDGSHGPLRGHDCSAQLFGLSAVWPVYFKTLHLFQALKLRGFHKSPSSTSWYAYKTKTRRQIALLLS